MTDPSPAAADGGTASAATGMAAALAHNIRTLEARRRADAAAAPLTERLSNRITCFVGSMTFVGIHLVAYTAWILVNLGVVPGVRRFDPTFVVLGMEASVEAIFLSTFVLISQNRMAAVADRRADLDLHVNLLTEHELTKLAALVERIAEKIGVAATDPAFAEIKRDVAPQQVLDVLDEAREA